jgi:WhiB family redox-sensing transcriptional regulator
MQVKLTGAPARGRDWRASGACLDEDSELFFPTGTNRAVLAQAAAAIAVCAGCPVAGECLSWALESGERFGVWGGLSERDRRAVMRSRSVLAGRAARAEQVAGHPARRASVLTVRGRVA